MRGTSAASPAFYLEGVVAVLKKHFPNFAVLRIVNQPNGA